MINIEDIKTEFGLFYKDGGQGLKDVARRLQQRSVSEQALGDLRITTETKLHKASSEMTRVMQAFQKGWTPISTISFDVESIDLHSWKIDAEVYPDEIEESWLGFLASSDLDRKTWPFVKYWIDSVLKQYEYDYEMHEVFHGVRGVITPKTATEAGKSINGFNKVINDLITAGKTAPIMDVAVPTDPVEFVTYMEKMTNEIPAIYRGMLEPWRMSEELGERFVDGMDKKYNGTYARENDLFKIRNRPATIATYKNENGVVIPGLPSHHGSEKIWTTIRGNSVVGKKKQGNSGILRLENIDRLVKAYTDGYTGVGFWVGGYVFTNDK